MIARYKFTKIDVEGSDPAEIHRESEMFTRLAASQPDITVSRPEEAAPGKGQKGAGFELGTMLVALVTSGAVTALVNVLKVYFDRDKNISIKIENPDGRKIDISASNLKPERLQETISALNQILEQPV